MDIQSDEVAPLKPTKPKRSTRFVVYRSEKDYYDNFYSSSDSDDEREAETCAEKSDIVSLARNINSLDDLLKMCDLRLTQCLPCNKNDLRNLKKIRNPLESLNRMIGMDKVKKTIIYQVLYFCQNLHKITLEKKKKAGIEEGDEGSLLHTVIHGSPGTGKTTLAKIIGKIYLKLGILTSDKFVIAKRKDLIGEYLGQTAPKTTKILESAKGGVLFIDEAYSLGNDQKKDIYAKECIDTINQYLTEHKHEIAVIVAGYKEDLQRCFFAYNKGLERRFPWVYHIDKYNHQHLQQIFIKQVSDSGWGFADDPNKIIPTSLFKKNMEFFKFGGGDTEIFFDKCKLAHSMNTFGLSESVKGKFTKRDIKKGLELHISHKGGKEEVPEWLRHYYI